MDELTLECYQAESCLQNQERLPVTPSPPDAGPVEWYASLWLDRAAQAMGISRLGLDDDLVILRKAAFEQPGR